MREMIKSIPPKPPKPPKNNSSPENSAVFEQPPISELQGEYLPGISATASADECTGLTPAMPQDDEQLESYLSLYQTEIPPDYPVNE